MLAERRARAGRGKVRENSRSHEGGWKKVVAPSALAFADNYPMPQALRLMAFKKLSPLLQQQRVALVKPVFVSLRSMLHMAI